MGASVLHIKTEVECKVLLFDEEKGIAVPNIVFSIEVNYGYQDLLFISTTEDNTCHYSTILIEKNDTNCQINLHKTDFQKLSPEIILLIKNACQGNVEAQAKLGACYVEGRGLIKNDYNTGLQLLKRAVEAGNPYAQNAVGFCFLHGWGVTQDYYKAVMWFKKAAEQGNKAAQYHLASCYEWGYGVDKNFEEAFKWMNKAADQGLPQAQISLGSYYEKGIGVTVNLAESLNWYTKAASKGDINAINGIKRVKQQMPEEADNLTKTSSTDYIDSIIDEQGVRYSSDGKSLLKCLNQDIQEYRVREGCEVIKDKAFYIDRMGRCCSLKTIILPNSITHIGDEAFLGCGDLVHISLSQNLIHIGNSAFELCGELTKIDLPLGLVHLGSRAFFGCKNISSIVLPPKIKAIEDGTFGGCSKLYSIELPVGIQSIGKDAFFLCHSIISIVLPDGLTSINNHAFASCDSLTSISLPNTLDYIGQDAFRWSYKLKNIIIPIGSLYKFQEIIPVELTDRLIEESFPNDNNALNINKPYYLFFDTETTGVPKNYNAPASNTSNWPRLVQLGWILTDESGNEISSGNEIVKPEGFTIPSDASRVHGITTEVALRDGKLLKQVIESFLKDTVGIKCLVGHNVSFDQKVVGAELYRLGITDTISTAKSLDTMKAATNYCKILGTYGYKWPKLIELHRKLFGCDFEDAHDAMADITATKKCFFEMRRRNLI